MIMLVKALILNKVNWLEDTFFSSFFTLIRIPTNTFWLNIFFYPSFKFTQIYISGLKIGNLQQNIFYVQTKKKKIKNNFY